MFFQRIRTLSSLCFLESPVTCTDKHVTISDTLNVGDHVTNANADYMDLYHPNSSFAIESVSPSFPVTIDHRSGKCLYDVSSVKGEVVVHMW